MNQLKLDTQKFSSQSILIQLKKAEKSFSAFHNYKLSLFLYYCNGAQVSNIA